MIDTNIYLSHWPFRRLPLDEPPALDALQQAHPRRSGPGGVDGGERHGVGQRHAGLQRVVEPELELPDRIALRVGFRESRAHVFLAQVGDLHVGILPSRPANEWRFSLGKSLTRPLQFGIFSSTALQGRD